MKQVFLGFLISISLFSNAQIKSKETLFTINDKPFYTDEFVRVYNKNLDLVKDESQKDLNQYLELFVGYKLKVTKANAIGLQNNVQYQNELKGYRTQLSKNYTSDSKVTKELVAEGYERMKKEINASHILILVDENASAEDTLIAYNKCLALRDRIIKGEDFGTVAQAESQDQSAKDNKGNLGYFTSFRMVYAFETAAFKTPVGQISMPIRTRFGYHIIKVIDTRENRGEVLAAHIMIVNPKEGDDKESAKNKIEEIYKKIQQGENFEELAKQFSEDKSSASKGGVLNRFGSGQLSSEIFENTTFALSKENPISKPFQSQYGWHIVKLIDKFPIKSFEDSKVELENKVSKDDRSRLITNSLTQKLKKKYQVKRDNKFYTTLAKLVTNDFYEGKWELPADLKPYNTKLLTLDAKVITGSDFLTYVNNQQKSGIATKPINKLVDILYNKFIEDQLNQYYDGNLEKEFPEFSAVMDEYRDGLLLFDLMEREIWERSKTDTLGLKNFYETQKDKHVWKTRYDACILSSTKIDMMKKATDMLAKKATLQELKDKLNTKDVVNIMANQGVYEEDSETLPKEFNKQEGISPVTKQGDYYFATKVDKVMPATLKTFDECKGKIINDYQQYLEQNWVSELKKEYTVKVNQDVLEKVKKQLKK